MKQKREKYDIVVIGGGLAGFCAAVASARHGARTCLVQDRPVFGGNSSSEIRVTPHGAAAFHAYARETGIVSELLIEERARNHETIFENGWTNSVWDLALYDMAMATPNLTFHVNTSVAAVRQRDQRNISAVIGRVAAAETEIAFEADIFIDCTGDGLVAAEAGCEWRMGTEGAGEFQEPHAPPVASADTMGNSIHFRCRDMGRPVPFQAPSWAMHYEDAGYFYQQGRHPKDVRGGFWWLEIGVPWNTIHDAEDIRHELTRHALGVWDWMKNRDPKTKDLAANWALDWIGQVPGKRESRRIVGQYLMTEHDPQNRTVFRDEIAFGGWFIDLHTPGGLLAPSSEPASAEGYTQTSNYAAKSYAGPYGIPLRILIAKDIDNLMMAGRNVSVTHAALGTVRVQGTTALMGQAAGTTAALALRRGLRLDEMASQGIFDIQQALLRDGCFLLNYGNQDPLDLARAATAIASSEALLRGASPESRGAHEGLDIWRDQAVPVVEALTKRRGQWIALGCGRLDEVAVCLSNGTPEDQMVEAVLVRTDSIWDYRAEPPEPLAMTTLRVPGGAKRHWTPWPLGLSALASGTYVRIDLLPNGNVQWHAAGLLIPGHLCAFEMSPGKMRRFGPGITMSFLVTPPQPCFGPANVLSGVTRPHRFTNLWRSDPAEPLPQWLELAWRDEQTVGCVELVFPGHLIREYHAYGPFYRDPQCPRDYVILARVAGAWKELVRVEGNYQRHRRHQFQPVAASRIRIEIGATNGDPSAAIYEVRCYKEAS
ncbi:MAG: FAD-dependent oxidoreductase [Candidatus Solibacter sp.]|jgi:hypothetical protein